MTKRGSESQRRVMKDYSGGKAGNGRKVACTYGVHEGRKDRRAQRVVSIQDKGSIRQTMYVR